MLSSAPETRLKIAEPSVVEEAPERERENSAGVIAEPIAEPIVESPADESGTSSEMSENPDGAAVEVSDAELEAAIASALSDSVADSSAASDVSVHPAEAGRDEAQGSVVESHDEELVEELERDVKLETVSSSMSSTDAFAADATAELQGGETATGEQSESTVSDDQVESALHEEPVRTGWRSVAGRLIGRARRALGVVEATPAKPKPKARKATGNKSAKKRAVDRSKAGVARKPRAKTTAAKPKVGLWGRLLEGVGLAKAPKSSTQRKRKPGTAKRAPTKPRTRSARSAPAAPVGLLARTLSRFGWGKVEEPVSEPVTQDADTVTTGAETVKKKPARVRKPRSGAKRKPSQSAQKDDTPRWRRVLRKLLSR